MKCCRLSPMPLSLSNVHWAPVTLCPPCLFLLISRETREWGCLGPEASVVSPASGYVCPHHSQGTTPPSQSQFSPHILSL